MNFLEETFDLLKLTDITAVHGRAEEYAKTKPTEKALIFAYQEQYPIWQLFLNTACPM